MYKLILCAIDLDDADSSKSALPTAVEYCRVFDAKLELLTIVPEMGPGIVNTYFPENYQEQMVEDAAKGLRELAAGKVPEEIATEFTVAIGTVYDKIISAAEKSGADLIIMASHRPELRDYLLGPNAARVVRHARCSVLVVRD